jgi:hypothetical protein
LNGSTPVTLTKGDSGVFTITCTGSGGSASASVTVYVATTTTVISLSKVQNLTATPSGTSVNLSWSSATASNGIAFYNIYRSTTSGFTPGVSNRIAQGNVLAYTDSGLSAGTYYYAVDVQDTKGNTGVPSDPVSATVTKLPVACPMVMPVCPYGYQAVTNGNGCVTRVCNAAPVATTYNGTVVVSLDSSSPAAGTIIPGQTGVTLAKIKLAASGGNAIVQSLSAVSDSASAVSGLSNIKIYSNDGSLWGGASSLQAFPSAQGGYVNISGSVPIALTSGSSVILTLVADISSPVSGSLDLGIGGGGGNYATMSPNYSIYGNSMTVSSAQGSASSGTSGQTAIIAQSFQNILNGISNLLKSL